MKIEIDDEVWNLFKKSWALLEVTDYKGLVRMLEVQMWEGSSDVIDDAERNPEAYGLQEISLKDDRREKNEKKIPNCPLFRVVGLRRFGQGTSGDITRFYFPALPLFLMDYFL